MTRVYASLPVRGPQGRLGRELLRGAELALGATRDRDSVLGRYSIDADGHTTTTAYGRLAVAEGELVWDRG